MRTREMPSASPDEVTPLVTVSVVTWNHAESIGACLTSLVRQTHRRIEIIVRDNASDDATVDVVQAIEVEHRDYVTLHRESINTGFCGGHNANLVLARGSFVLLANPDMVFEPDYIEEALRAFGHGSDVGAVCGVLLQSYGAAGPAIVDGAGLAVSRSRQFYLLANGQPEKTLPNEDFEVFGSDGAAPMYRKQLIVDCSVDGEFFDDAFFAHKEDHDIAWRARLLGWKTICARRAIALHPRHFKPGNLAVRRLVDPVIRRRAVRNQLLLIIKNDDVVNVILDAPWIVARQLTTLVYVALFERDSLPAYLEMARCAKRSWRLRKLTMTRRRATSAEVRAAMQLGIGRLREARVAGRVARGE